MKDYHALMEERSHPLHCFNNPKLDAKYFPDPMRDLNYLNPARLWDGLLQFGILRQKDSVYEYDESLALNLKEMEAREGYKDQLLDLEKKILASGGYENMSASLLAQSIQALAMLAKLKDGSIVFRREISFIIADILDGDGTAERAKEKNLSKDAYIEKYLKPPKFQTPNDLVKFLSSLDGKVRSFLIADIKKTIANTKSNQLSGAPVSLPASKVNATILPSFKDKTAFYEYFEKKGSLEWQRLMKEEMVRKMSTHLGSYDFRMDYDPTLLDRKKITDYLNEMRDKLPDVVTWEVAVNNKIIK
jgi:hypothetical protein